METYEEDAPVPKSVTVIGQRQRVETREVLEEQRRAEVVLRDGQYCQVDVVETVTREVDEPCFDEVESMTRTAGKSSERITYRR